MKSNYKKLGDIIDLVDIRNTDNSVNNLLGLTIDKHFINSVANIVGTDLTKYKIIHRNEFAVSLMQVSRDAKIPIACLFEFDSAILSPAYSIFKIKNTNEILPEYLDIWFKRSEFDREAAFIAVGGVRGSMPFEEFCRINVNIPPYEEQLKIVKDYNIINDCINIKKKINENLENIAQSLYKKLFISDINYDELPRNWHIKSLDSVADISAGGDCPSVYSEKKTSEYNIPIFSNGVSKEGLYGYTDKAKIYDESVTISARGTIGYVCLRDEPYLPIIRLISVIPKTTDISSKYLYFTLKNFILKGRGTSQEQITVPDLMKKNILLPDNYSMKKFTSYVNPLFSYIAENKKVILQLYNMQQILLSRLANE